MSFKPKVIVCGGRDYAVNDRQQMATMVRRLNALRDQHGGAVTIIEGGATGADTIAWLWATIMGQNVITVPVTPDEWRAYGKRAGPYRNRRMLDVHQPDFVIAFPGGRGTANMTKLALEKARAGRIAVERVT